MKNKVLQAGAFTLWVFFSAQLIAAPSAEIKVSGKIKYSGCSVIAGNNGVYDYGAVLGIASGGGKQLLPTLRQTWQIRCEGDAYLALIPTDNRAASRSEPALHYFGLGNTPEGLPIGYFMLGLAQSSVNGAPALLRSRSSTTALPSAAVSLRSGERTEWLQPDATRAAGRIYTMDISVTPVLTATTPVTDKAALDGSVTLSFVFGL